MKIWLCIYTLFLFTSFAFGQSGAVKRALKQLDKKDFEKVVSTLLKAEEKDSLYSGLFYTKSKLYFTSSFSRYNIDSAHHYMLKGQQLFELLDQKEKDKLIKIGAGLLDFDTLKNSIDSTAFERAKSFDTESGYVFYLANFSPSNYDDRTVALRNSRAFDKARSSNTYQAYLQFMRKYPTAEEFKDAEERYERLYFEKSTADGKLESYQKFLKAHRTTTYRKEVERNIYNIMTADYKASSFHKFKTKYPSSYLAKLAEKFEYHLSKEEDRGFNAIYLLDSLNQIDTIPTDLLFYLQAQKYGLMDLSGREITKPRFTDLRSEYLCKGISGDVFLSNQTLYSTSGVSLASDVLDIKDFGYGLVVLEHESGLRVIHKSGYVIHEGLFDDVRFINNQFLAYKVGDEWGLRTVSGVVILAPQCDDIFTVDDFILFEKNGQLDIKVSEQLVYAADNNPLTLQYIFDDFELVDNSSIWLHSAYGQVVFDRGLNELIPYHKQKIDFLPFGYGISDSDGYHLLNDSFQRVDDKNYSSFDYNDNFIITTSDSIQTLLRTENYVVLAENEEIELYGSRFAVIQHEDTLVIYGNGASKSVIAFGEKPTLISSTDSREFLKVNKGRGTFVISESGNSYELTGYDSFSTLDDFLITSKNKRRGAYYDDQLAMAPEYDAIGLQEEGLTILLNGKFGLYSKEQNLRIEPRYDKRLTRYNERLLIGFRNDEFIFLDDEGDKVSTLDAVTSIEYWQDSVALVKDQSGWQFFNIYENSFSERLVKSFTVLKDDSNEKLVIALGEEGYGVLSNKRGEIIPLSFNDVVQIGPEQSPVFFTEKHISEAEFYVVIYYSDDGKVLKKQAFDSADYEMIYCDK